MTLTETVLAEIGPITDLEFSRLRSDAVLTDAFSPVVDFLGDGLAVPIDIVNNLEKTLRQRYTEIFEQLPQDSRYKKFGETIRSDIVELLSRLGHDATYLYDKASHDFTRSAEQRALEDDVEDMFDGAALLVGSFIRKHITVFPAAQSDKAI
jgi:hypothetical protein